MAPGYTQIEVFGLRLVQQPFIGVVMKSNPDFYVESNFLHLNPKQMYTQFLRRICFRYDVPLGECAHCLGHMSIIGNSI